ncbi:MAG: NAD(P)-dependent oxidoreductase [Lentisphaerae bacterium]|nr:NAD(P)-dependent oxidoreductase [Lentisphaerota bacterium]
MSAKQRILITGGTGFFGKSILSEWQRAPRPNTELVILSRNSNAFLAANPCFQGLQNVSFVNGDVRDFAFPDGDFSAVIHAATPATQRIDDAEMSSIILEGTKRILEFCKTRSIQRLLYISSGAVYGEMPAGIKQMTESMPCHPQTVYGKSKLQAEQLCLDGGIECGIARCFAFIGEYLPLDQHFAIGNFIQDCLLQKPIHIKGDGTALRSYLYARDLVHQLWALFDCAAPHLIINIGSDQAISIRELAELVRECAETNNEIIVSNLPGINRTVNRYIPDVSLTRKYLNIEKITSLENALRQVIRFHRNKTAQCRND